MSDEVVPIDDLHIDPGNTRRHPERNMAGIKASLARFGPARSIVCDGKNVVRAGNGTLEAARAVGITKVRVIDADEDELIAVRRKDWSATEAAAYSIGDNHLTDTSEDDDQALAEQLRALQSEDFDLGAIGYDAGEVDALIESLSSEALGDVPKPGSADSAGEQDLTVCPKCGFEWNART